MKSVLALTTLALLAGCKTAAPAGEYQWSVKSPSQVTLGKGSRLKFTVETRAHDGQAVADVPFLWVVEWVGVHGVEHQGYSSREEDIAVKGGPGKATLRILASHGDDKRVEVARAEFTVVSETLPAK